MVAAERFHAPLDERGHVLIIGRQQSGQAERLLRIGISLVLEEALARGEALPGQGLGLPLGAGVLVVHVLPIGLQRIRLGRKESV